MNKIMTIGMATLLVAGVAGAQSDVVMVGQAPADDPSIAKVTAEAALVSAYVWRGQVYNSDAVIQPQITISQYDFSFNVWANYDLKKNVAGISSDFSELALSLAYTLPVNLNEMEITVGAINYTYPNSLTESTTEFFASAVVLSYADYFIPSATLFGDIDEVRGSYILLDVVAPYQVSDYLAVEGGVSAGYGNTAYNDAYFPNAAGDQDAGFNDYNFYVNAAYDIYENVTLSANVTYTFLEGGSIRRAADANYEAKQKLWGGVNVIYDF
ncbi:MAG: MipA/OmpV family protein [Pontiella sp.]|nr:MipA/OmpV family protein [Pontiella sp.]NNJ71170.1 hypothetical protein [Kiritimatiellales bacterium]